MQNKLIPVWKLFNPSHYFRYFSLLWLSKIALSRMNAYLYLNCWDYFVLLIFYGDDDGGGDGVSSYFWWWFCVSTSTVAGVQHLVLMDEILVAYLITFLQRYHDNNLLFWPVERTEREMLARCWWRQSMFIIYVTLTCCLGLQWFSKLNITGNSEVLNALSAIASSTSFAKISGTKV